VAEGLLAGVRVLEHGGEVAQRAGRILADLGADVVKIEPRGGDPLRRSAPLIGQRSDAEASLRFAAWNAGKRNTVLSTDNDLVPLAMSADVVIVELHPTDTTSAVAQLTTVDAERKPSVVSITPFGGDGPRSQWRAGDLGVMAASGNMHVTGDPDRAPLRCSEPAGYAHAAAEVAMAALTALASGRPQQVDVSMQEAVMIASMCGPAQYPATGSRGRRSGAVTGRTREVWRCKGGHVSFGLRGGGARVANLQTITRLLEEEGLGTPALSERDWTAYSHERATDDELRAIEAPIAGYFERHTMAELFVLACTTPLLLAPANTAAELLRSTQLRDRGFFVSIGELDDFPLSFAKLEDVDGGVAQPGPRSPAPRLQSAASVAWPRRPPSPSARGEPGAPAWQGTRILEFGAGAAGPIATRYFAEHGATVIRVESRLRPDFLRIYAAGGLETSPLFNGLNVGKLSVSLNLKHPDGVAVARRLVSWADAVSENFAPRAMRGLGLDYATLSVDKPDLVMVSACLMGQTGPQRDYPGFGGQGSALCGYAALTGWPDREPLGPYGTITDSLAPRFVATCLAAALLYKRRTGRGVHVDLSQVEAAAFSLSPWLLDQAVNGTSTVRMGNRSPLAVPHGAFPCAGDDRWLVIAVWSDDEWARLASLTGVGDTTLATLAGRQARVDEVEALLADWTSARDRDSTAQLLQEAGIEAVPVEDWGDLHDDPHITRRHHFVPVEHPVQGHCLVERNGFRLSDAQSGYARPGPLLGEHTDDVLGDILGLTATQRHELAESGALQ
jgi:crotonobetainyl-CoA:carnitine CoA-transferase CaiB-like acyl-CoA transferase